MPSCSYGHDGYCARLLHWSYLGSELISKNIIRNEVISMMCPLNKKFTICQDANGYFMGTKDGERICCRITDYVPVYASVLVADKYSIPVRSACPNSDCVLCKEVVTHE